MSQPRVLVLAVALVLVALAGAAVVGRTLVSDPGPDQPSAAASDHAPPPTGTPGPAAPGGPTTEPTSSVDAATLLTDPAAAASATTAELRDTAATLVDDTVTPEWRDRVRAEMDAWPVAVGSAGVAADGQVTFDVVLAGLAPTRGDRLVLRALPAARVLGRTGYEVTATTGGQPVPVDVDREGARLLLEVAGDDTLGPVRLEGSYTVPELEQVTDDGGPAGFGLLARDGGVTTLAHWLPLPVLPSDAGPMLPRGDVGAFPTASWSVVVDHPHDLVTGGTEADCPQPRDGCTWARGVGLRDVSAVVLDTGSSARAPVDGQGASAGPTRARVVAHVPAGSSADPGPVAEVAAAMTTGLGDHLGGLPWPVVDVVPVRFRAGAAGMEFPGMVWVDRSAWQPDGFGAYVVAHEVGHQWFHALVGNGSLSAPVVDESLAQYAAYLAFVDHFGQDRADTLAQQYFGGRHDAALADGVPDEPPAQDLGAFASDTSYGAAVYGRAGQAWVDAERAVGREVLVAALHDLVAAHGLGSVDEATVLAVVEEASGEAARILRDGWGVPHG